MLLDVPGDNGVIVLKLSDICQYRSVARLKHQLLSLGDPHLDSEIIINSRSLSREQLMIRAAQYGTVRCDQLITDLKRLRIFILLKAALIFSAGYYCARIFFFYFVKLFFALQFCRFFDILREIFLTSLG